MCAFGFLGKVVTRQPNARQVVGSIHARNIEPMTSCLLDKRSNHLSYGASLEEQCFIV